MKSLFPGLRLSVKLSFLLMLLPPAALAQSSQTAGPAEIKIDRDGILLDGKFYKAEGTGKLPTLILLQGSPGNQFDVLGIGRVVSAQGINAFTFNYSGTHLSQGFLTFPNCLEDISAAYRFLRNKENIDKFSIDTARILLAGYSFGGGMAMTYAIKHPEIKSVISIAGNDLGKYFGDYMKDPAMKAGFDANLKKAIEAGFLRFEPGKSPEEMGENWLKMLDPAFYTERNAQLLAGRDILLIGGWDDAGVTLERYVLPLYRALRKNPGQKVTVVSFQDDHTFGKSRAEVAQAIIRFTGATK